MTKTIFNKSGRLVVEDFLQNAPLYEEYDISYVPVKTIRLIEFFRGTIDTYCIDCGRDATFYRIVERPPNYIGQASTSLPDPEDGMIHETRTFQIVMFCTRDPSHEIIFVFRVLNGTLIKIGQYPSVADLLFGNSKNYTSVLMDEDRKELSRAIGLYAHGIGIGSFVYLRRIFEKLVERAHIDAKKSHNWNEGEFEKARMHDKIKSLSNFLPDALVENADIYSILSVGLHSLREDECLRYFETVRRAIELILTSELERKERERLVQSLKSEIGQIKGELGR